MNKIMTEITKELLDMGVNINVVTVMEQAGVQILGSSGGTSLTGPQE